MLGTGRATRQFGKHRGGSSDKTPCWSRWIGSIGSCRRAVAARAWPAGTRVEVIAALDFRFWVAIVSYGSPAWDWIGQSADDENSWARKAVEGVAKELTAVGLVATAVVQEGNPKHVLVDEATRLSADCIFVGAKGYSRLERLLIGSVSSSVVATARCSVEIVRQG